MDLFARLQLASLRKTNGLRLEFEGLDTLNLTLGKIIQTDLGQTRPPREFDFRVKNRIITELKTEQDVQSKLVPVFVRAGIALLTDGLFKPLKGPVKPVAGAGERSAVKTLESTGAQIKK